ncbi:MAG: hypothetical protein ACRCZJ_02305 [Erysipelotrichaceae bacterium]
MLKKQIHHLEFFTILYLLGLPFILHFFQTDNFFYLLLLVFLDGIYIWLIDEAYLSEQLFQHLDRLQEDKMLQRIAIYLLGIFTGTFIIGFKSFPLFLILVANVIVISLTDRIKTRLIKKYKINKM